jgi:hypothetical protein
MIIAFYNDDGEIITVKSGPNKDDLLAGADPALKYIETDMQPSPFSSYVNDDGIQTIPDQPSESHEWDKKKKEWRADNASLMKYVRKIRDSKLKETDYTQVSDIPFGQQKKNNWVQYRQKLRDLPSEFPNAYLPEHITWPDPPQD